MGAATTAATAREHHRDGLTVVPQDQFGRHGTIAVRNAPSAVRVRRWRCRTRRPQRPPRRRASAATTMAARPLRPSTRRAHRPRRHAAQPPAAPAGADRRAGAARPGRQSGPADGMPASRRRLRHRRFHAVTAGLVSRTAASVSSCSRLRSKRRQPAMMPPPAAPHADASAYDAAAAPRRCRCRSRSCRSRLRRCRCRRPLSRRRRDAERAGVNGAVDGERRMREPEAAQAMPAQPAAPVDAGCAAARRSAAGCARRRSRAGVHGAPQPAPAAQAAARRPRRARASNPRARRRREGTLTGAGAARSNAWAAFLSSSRRNVRFVAFRWRCGGALRYSGITPAHRCAPEPATAACQLNMAAPGRLLDTTDLSRYFPYDGN